MCNSTVYLQQKKIGRDFRIFWAKSRGEEIGRLKGDSKLSDFFSLCKDKKIEMRSWVKNFSLSARLVLPLHPFTLQQGHRADFSYVILLWNDVQHIVTRNHYELIIYLHLFWPYFHFHFHVEFLNISTPPTQSTDVSNTCFHFFTHVRPSLLFKIKQNKI